MIGVRGLLGFAAAILGLAAIPVYAEQPLAQSLPDLIVGLAALAVAATTWKSARGVSALALALAATWWAGTVWPEAAYWHRGVLIHLTLSAPGLWPRSWIARGAVVGGYLLAAAGVAWQIAPAAVAMAAFVAVAGIAESRSHRRPGLRVVGPVLVAAAIAAGTLVPDLVGSYDGALLALHCYDALLVGVLVAVALLVRSPSRDELTDLAVDLGDAPVRDAETLTALVQAEPGLTIDADLQAALETARRLEKANDEIREQVRSAVIEVDESRRRLVMAAAFERARLARQLTDLAADRLRILQDRAAEAEVSVPALARAADGVERAMLGLRPPSLDGGLAAALREHPLVASLGASLDLADRRCDEVVEDALYATAVECLANAAKHAGPCRVRVRYSLTGSRATLTVSDDGVGGAVPGRGTGLTGLADRLEALGGGLELVSGPGAGTSVTAWAPRALTAGGGSRRTAARTRAEP